MTQLNVKAMSSRDKRILGLWRIGRSYREIAKQLGLSPGMVSGAIARNRDDGRTSTPRGPLLTIRARQPSAPLTGTLHRISPELSRKQRLTEILQQRGAREATA